MVQVMATIPTGLDTLEQLLNHILTIQACTLCLETNSLMKR